MKSRWSEPDAKALMKEYNTQGVNEDIAIRTYTTRILGQEPQLVLHGGDFERCDPTSING